MRGGFVGQMGPPKKGGASKWLPDIAPVESWRVPVSDAYDSGADAALRTSLINNASKTLPSYTVTAGNARTIAYKPTSMTGAGGLLSFHVDKADYTVGLASSLDSTNGSDGTWSTISFSKLVPSSTLNQSAYYMRQALVLAPGAVWYRLVITAGAEDVVVNPLLHQLQTDGRNDIHLDIGASNENRGRHPVDMEAAIRAAYPNADPVCLKYTIEGAGTSTLLPACSTVNAAWPFARYIHLGMVAGNNVTELQPISDDPPSALTTFRAQFEAMLNSFSGKYVFATDVSFRAYSGVTVDAPNDGSLPYCQQILWPAIQASASNAWDVTYLVPRLWMYGWGVRNDDQLIDAVHYGTNGGANYANVRAEQVRTEMARIYAGTWGKNYALLLVEQFETDKLQSQKTELGYVMSALPGSPAKTALQNRINAVVVAPNPIKIRFGTNAPLAGWNSTNNFATGVSVANLNDELGNATGIGFEMVLPGNGAFTSGGDTGAGSTEFPPSVRGQYISDTVDSMSGKLTGLDNSKQYTVKVMGSRAGAGMRNVDYSVNGGAVQTIAVLGNTSSVATFTNVSPAGGEISVLAARGMLNVTAVYFNGIIIQQQ